MIEHRATTGTRVVIRICDLKSTKLGELPGQVFWYHKWVQTSPLISKNNAT
eukprot:CAMPEP_0204147450 /NCGR_PEP_ID=MMETSP0361-20130328/22758_1 /ASSEMBLY_ACC=CAM_ASM_000343 /TAXON_ID=268821 /ORGANISM="Scrippsiella Hangoei, Strain SHTV-5" /LENGTH=50 /DNA_ID=CAMNT_0051101647 /DNA_START=167 /DNA_END=316 /DNA_ORIENTATION=-